jgi:RNA polymerase sigma factor (sigma-70 family)
VTDSAFRGAAAGLPSELISLLKAPDEVQANLAWERFLKAYHKLVLYAIRSTERDHDAVMDRYAYVLDQLRKDNFRRLRAFAAGGRAKFSTWLVFVTHRLVSDYVRQKYGRERGPSGPAASERREARRHLADLISSAVDVSALTDLGAANPLQSLWIEERQQALVKALAGRAARDRLLLSLRFEDDLSAGAIAEAMGYPSPFHVYRRLKRVLAELRAELEAEGIDEPGV